MVIICTFLIPLLTSVGAKAQAMTRYSLAVWLTGDVGDDSSGNGFCHYLRYFAWAAGMQIAFPCVFPEHLAVADRRGDRIAFLAAILPWNRKYPAFKDRSTDGDIL